MAPSQRGKRIVGGGKSKNNLGSFLPPSVADKGQKVVCNAAYVGKKLLKSTGKAAWLTVTTVLVLALPLMFVLDREQQFTDMDVQQEALLGVRAPM